MLYQLNYRRRYTVMSLAESEAPGDLTPKCLLTG
jgi:hypothetical protein